MPLPAVEKNMSPVSTSTSPSEFILSLAALPVANFISLALIPKPVNALPALLIAWNPAVLPISPIPPLKAILLSVSSNTSNFTVGVMPIPTLPVTVVAPVIAKSPPTEASSVTVRSSVTLTSVALKVLKVVD